LLSWTAAQAKGYAERERVLRIIVTDGLRYGVFWRANATQPWPEKPGAYLNLIRPRDRYEIYDCRGAKEAIWAMTPDWQPEP